jgi:hypothetical protein
MNATLAKAVRDKTAILFVGAGVSRTLGLPNLRELISHLAAELGYDPEIFSTFGDYLSLAEFYRETKGTIGPLRSWLDRKWHEGIDISKSEVHRLIVELDFPTIYTTNYDHWIEKAYHLGGKSFIKIAKVTDIPAIQAGQTQIVKFHGDFDDDDSIVLTESDYFERLRFESPLDIKLRADLLGKSMLFIGYSLSDINIRLMLFRLQRLWRDAGASERMPQSFVFLTSPNPVQERILHSRGLVPIISESDDPCQGLISFLKDLLHEATGRAEIENL